MFDFEWGGLRCWFDFIDLVCSCFVGFGLVLVFYWCVG